MVGPFRRIVVTGGRVVCFGDIVNDIVAVPRGEIRADTDTPSTIRALPGGSAANTAAWLGSLGAPVDFVGCVGTVDADHHAGLLREQGVEAHLSVVPGVPTSSIVIIVQDQQRHMLTERGANAALTTDALTDEVLEGASVLHLTGYSLLDGPRVAGMRRLIERAHAAGVTVSLNPGSAGYVADFGPADFVEGITGIDILFANVGEAALLCDETEPESIARAMADRYGLAVITRGPSSVLVAERGGEPEYADVPDVRLVDPTGAGDALAAGFLAARLAGRTPLECARAGIVVAARSVMVLGGRPPI